MTIIVNSLLNKSLISVSLRSVSGVLSHSLVWNISSFFIFTDSLCWLLYLRWKSYSLSLDRVIPCKQISYISMARAPSCLKLLWFSMLPSLFLVACSSSECVRPVSILKRKTAVSTWMQADWKLYCRQQQGKYSGLSQGEIRVTGFSACSLYTEPRYRPFWGVGRAAIPINNWFFATDPWHYKHKSCWLSEPGDPGASPFHGSYRRGSSRRV